MTDSLRWIVWKCLVLPGVDETDTFLAPISALMVEDFPTLGYPTRPICVFLRFPVSSSTLIVSEMAANLDNFNEILGTFNLWSML